jgi:molybdopterin/thiamine biosynthesis adenylyltransferase
MTDVLRCHRWKRQMTPAVLGGCNACMVWPRGPAHPPSTCRAVVGIGGVGSWVAEALARSGVARLTLIDMDHIAESNINRQIHALSTTTGQAKVLAMRERIALIHAALPSRCG